MKFNLKIVVPLNNPLACFAAQKNAFTLAEVLVTLLIIGVVAAMTIPTLINKIQDSQYKSLLKKQVAVASDAFRRAAVENGGSLAGYSSVSGDNSIRANDFRDLVSPYLSYVKSCETFQIADCAPVKAYNTFYDVPFPGGWAAMNAPSTYKDAALILNDGSIWRFFAFYSSMGTCTANWIIGKNNACGGIRIDTNGAKGPNKAGCDLYEFHVASDGTLVPLGSVNDLHKNSYSLTIGYNPRIFQMLDISP